MKSFKKIAILLCVVAGIVAFWLIPGINKATDVKYTRLYEDTDVKKSPGDSIHVKRKRTGVKILHPIVIPKVHYKQETISSSAKLRHLKPSMFSRSMQFTTEKEIELIDTLNQITSADTAKVIQ